MLKNFAVASASVDKSLITSFTRSLHCIFSNLGSGIHVNFSTLTLWWARQFSPIYTTLYCCRRHH